MEELGIYNASLYVRGENIFSKVDISVSKGTCHAIVGPDNQGKSSLLYAALGQNSLSSGDIIFFEDTDSSFQKVILSRVGFVPDELLSFPDMTGLEFLQMTLELRHVKDWYDYADMLLDYFDLDASVPLIDITDNDNKCFYIISAILSEPEFLILDEPFNYLNEKTGNLLKEWIKAYVSSGNTVLVTSDNFEDIKDISDYITVMSDRTVIRKAFPVASLKEYTLIVAYGVDLHTIPDNVIIVEQNVHSCSIFFDGTKEELLEILGNLKCSKFTVNHITEDDILYNKYPWLEDVLCLL